MIRHFPRLFLFLALPLGGALAPQALSASPAVVTAPNELGQPGLWLVASDLAGALAEGQPVTRWPDRSGHGYDAVFEARIPQAALAVGLHRPPTFHAHAVAGLPAVSFNALERQTLVLNTAGRALGQKVSGFTAAFVVCPSLVYPPAPSADMPWTKRRYLFISHLSDFSTRVSVQVMQDTGRVNLLSRPLPGAALDRLSSGSDDSGLALRDSTWQRLIVTVDYRSKEARIFIDGQGVSHALSPSSAQAFEDLPSAITGIGSTTLGDWLSCQLAELICYERALSIDEVHSLDAQFCRKYRLGR